MQNRAPVTPVAGLLAILIGSVVAWQSASVDAAPAPGNATLVALVAPESGDVTAAQGGAIASEVMPAATGAVSGTVTARGWLHSRAILGAWDWSAAPRAASPPSGRPASGRLTEVKLVQTSRPVLALTFDCGAADGALEQTLDTLARYGVRSTFFITGDFAERYPELVARIVADGHELANHTQTHRDLVDLSDDTIRRELRSTDEILSGFSGKTTKPLMRMPFGNRDPRVARIINEEGYRSIYWSIDSGDWRETATAPGVLETVLQYGEAGDIIVHHCSPVATATALPGILDALNERGLRPVTVSDLLQDE